MKKKIINGILLVAVLVAASSAFVSCKDNDADSQTELLGKIANLQTQIDNLKLQAGPQGPAGPQGAQGEKGEQGAPGANGTNGQDGLTPFIGDNGNWWIGTTDTGVKAQGEPGANGTNGTNGENGLTPFIGDNGNWWIGTTDTGVKAKGEDGKDATFDATEILDQLDQLQKDVEELKKQGGSGDPYDDKAINDAIKEIQDALDELAKKINVLTGGEIYSISADWVANSLVGFNLPVDFKTNLLLACFGEAKRDIYFYNPLTNERELVVEMGAYITNKTGNAGKVYTTVNPSNVDFSGKILKLVNTAGGVAPVTLSGLQPSDKVVKFATRGDNAFYEADATIEGDGFKALEFKFDVGDVEQNKETIKNFIKQRNKANLSSLLQMILNIFADNNMAAYRLQATWGDNNHTYSPADIAAISWRPFGYDFDLNEVANYDGDNMSALESLEEYVVNHSTQTQSTRNKIWRFLNKFNAKIAAPILNNVNAAIQPTLLIADSEGTAHPNVSENSSVFTRFKAGQITLMPTSWTAEIVAPAFKKFVAVVAVDGKAVEADDPINTGLLGQLIDGSVIEIPLTIEAGHVYRIQYSAMDYSGNVKNLYYNIRGAK